MGSLNATETTEYFELIEDRMDEIATHLDRLQIDFAEEFDCYLHA